MCNPLSFLIYIYPPITDLQSLSLCAQVSEHAHCNISNSTLQQTNLLQLWDIYRSYWEVFPVHTSMPWKVMSLSVQSIFEFVRNLLQFVRYLQHIVKKLVKLVLWDYKLQFLNCKLYWGKHTPWPKCCFISKLYTCCLSAEPNLRALKAY